MLRRHSRRCVYLSEHPRAPPGSPARGSFRFGVGCAARAAAPEGARVPVGGRSRSPGGGAAGGSGRCGGPSRSPGGGAGGGSGRCGAAPSHAQLRLPPGEPSGPLGRPEPRTGSSRVPQLHCDPSPLRRHRPRGRSGWVGEEFFWNVVAQGHATDCCAIGACPCPPYELGRAVGSERARGPGELGDTPAVGLGAGRPRGPEGSPAVTQRWAAEGAAHPDPEPAPARPTRLQNNKPQPNLPQLKRTASPVTFEA